MNAPQNLTPMEVALLSSLQQSSTEHARRISELESLLRQLVEHSQEDSDSASAALKSLEQRLDLFAMRLNDLVVRLDRLDPELKLQAESYTKATRSFSLMCDRYEKLASEAHVLREALQALGAG